MDKCREEFEQYIRDQSAFTADFQIGCNGQYKSDLMHFMFVTWQHQQAKVEELQTQLSLQRQRVKAFEEELTSSRNYGDELQKRVDELEFQLKDWKQKSMPAMLNGMCGRCGKEPLQGIGSDKEDYALLHCFGCGANKYEWIGEQALKGEG
ncbi:TPA: hypothetical protein ACJK1S_001243 [Acinetobacter baumannii]